MSTLQDIDPDCLDETGCDPVETIIVPRVGDIGNFEVKRALPSRERQMVGPFIFWDQMGPGEFLTNQGVDVHEPPSDRSAIRVYQRVWRRRRGPALSPWACLPATYTEVRSFPLSPVIPTLF